MKKQTKNLSRSNAIEDVSKHSHGRHLKKKKNRANVLKLDHE